MKDNMYLGGAVLFDVTFVIALFITLIGVYDMSGVMIGAFVLGVPMTIITIMEFVDCKKRNLKKNERH